MKINQNSKDKSKIYKLNHHTLLTPQISSKEFFFNCQFKKEKSFKNVHGI